MALIDDRGRVFGRVNLIDAIVAFLVLGVVPIAYFAWVLFRQPEPRLVSAEPTKITPAVTRIRIQGQNLRPYLRVSFNDIQGVTFGLINPTTADVELPALPAGTYDVILYDVAREISRLRGAVVVEGAPPLGLDATMLVAGSFVAIDDALLGELQPGAPFIAQGGSRLSLQAVGAPQPDTRPIQTGDYVLDIPLNAGRQVPAMLRATCTVVGRRCQVGGVDLEPGVAWAMFAGNGKPVRFVLAEAMAASSLGDADVLVRLGLPLDAAAMVRPGDRERGHPLLASHRAAVTSVGAARRVSGGTTWRGGTTFAAGGEWNLSLPDAATVVDVSVRLPLDHTTDGWKYRGHPLKVGGPFVFEAERYIARGWILRIDARKNAATDQ